VVAFRKITRFLVCLTLLTLVSTAAGPVDYVYAQDDISTKQADADEAASNSGREGPVYDALSTCIGDGYGSLSATYSLCVIERCDRMTNLQYYDACVKQGFNLHSCRGVADPNQTEAVYLTCVSGMLEKCNALPTTPVKGTNPKNKCLEAAAWYISRYSNTGDEGYNTTSTHSVAYVEYLPLLNGLNDSAYLDDAVLFVQQVRGEAPPPGEPFQDTDGDGIPDDEDINPTGEGCLNEAGEPVTVNPEDPNDTDCVIPTENNLDCEVDSNGDGVMEEGVQISIKIDGSDCIPKGDGSINQNPIISLLRLVLQVASAGVGLVVAVMIIVAGIQYSSAQGNPQLIQAAKQRLMNAIIGLVMYIFAFALLNYLVPGGLIG